MLLRCICKKKKNWEKKLKIAEWIDRYNDYYLKANFSSFALYTALLLLPGITLRCIECWKHDNNFLSQVLLALSWGAETTRIFRMPKNEFGIRHLIMTFIILQSPTSKEQRRRKSPDNTGVPCSSSRRREDEPRSACFGMRISCFFSLRRFKLWYTVLRDLDALLRAVVRTTNERYGSTYALLPTTLGRYP